MEQWTAQSRALVVEAYFKNGDLAVTTQGLFRRYIFIDLFWCGCGCNRTKTDQYNSHTTLKPVPTIPQ